MPVRLTGSYVKRLIDERLSQKSELKPDIGRILGLPSNRIFFDPRGSASLITPLLAACTEVISSGKRTLANGQLVRAEQLPPYESFCLLIYVGLSISFFEALSEAVAALPPNQKSGERTPVTAPDRERDAKSWTKELTSLAACVLDAEVNYLIGSAPDAAGKDLFSTLNDWACALLAHDGQAENVLLKIRQELSKSAQDRFAVWLAQDGEAQIWLREFLNFRPQEAARNQVPDSMGSLTAPLQNWTDGKSDATERRRDAWKVYRESLRELPDTKGTMFAEEFGVRQVFVQPLVSYEIAGSKARKQSIVPDIGSLIGSLVSNRVPGDELILFCGGPGSGKSTLCRIIASELAQNEAMHPVFLRLRRLKEGADIPSFVEENLRREGLIDRISELRGIQNLVLILDGFDELVMASRARLREFFNNLRSDLDDGPLKKVKAIVSGRDTLFPLGAGLPSGSHVIQLLPFDRPRVEAWGQKWRALNTGQGSEFRPEIFYEEERRNKASSPLHHLVTWPLTLHLVARVHRTGGFQTDQTEARSVEKAVLYRSILAETSRRQLDQTAGKGRLGDRETRTFLRAVAWLMHSTSRDSLDFSEVDPVLQKLFPDASETDRAELADVAVVNAPELTKGEERGFEFVHKSFAEFLTAERLAETLDRVAYKTPDYETGTPNWQMSTVEAVRAIAAELGIRLLPAEIQEMLEPMLGDFRSFVSESSVRNGESEQRDADALERKLARLEELIRISGSKESMSEVGRATATSLLVRAPLEAIANYHAALLVLASSTALRLTRNRSTEKKGRRAEMSLSDLFRIIHLVEAGGLAIDQGLSRRLFSGIAIPQHDGKPISVSFPPIAPGRLTAAAGLVFPLVRTVQLMSSLLRFSHFERQILYQLMGDRPRRGDRGIFESMGSWLRGDWRDARYRNERYHYRHIFLDESELRELFGYGGDEHDWVDHFDSDVLSDYARPLFELLRELRSQGNDEAIARLIEFSYRRYRESTPPAHYAPHADEWFRRFFEMFVFQESEKVGRRIPKGRPPTKKD